VSPDFSIPESMAQELKKKFHAQTCTTEKAALARFKRIFENEMSYDKIRGFYDWFTKRLHECERLEGQMTRY
jgi:hypothetical protein